MTRPTDIVLSFYLYEAAYQILFIALSNGKLFYFKRKNQDTRNILENQQKDPDLVEILSEKRHKGKVTQMLFEKISDLNVLLTGSAD